MRQSNLVARCALCSILIYGGRVAFAQSQRQTNALRNAGHSVLSSKAPRRIPFDEMSTPLGILAQRGKDQFANPLKGLGMKDFVARTIAGIGMNRAHGLEVSHPPTRTLLVKKNGIMMIDFAIEAQRQGK